MKLKNINGDGKPKPVGETGTKEIEFPVSYQLKAVMTVEDSETENRQKLTDVFTKLDIAHQYLKKKKSSKGTYISYSFKVTLTNREQMDRLYSDLKKIKSLKFAV